MSVTVPFCLINTSRHFFFSVCLFQCMVTFGYKHKCPYLCSVSTFFNKDKCALSLFSVHFCLINTSTRCLFNCSLLFNKVCVCLYQCPYVSFSGHFCLISRSAYVCFSVHMCFSVVTFGLISSSVRVSVQWSLLFNKNKCAYICRFSVHFCLIN